MQAGRRLEELDIAFSRQLGAGLTGGVDALAWQVVTDHDQVTARRRPGLHFKRTRSHDHKAVAAVEALRPLIMLPHIQVDALGTAQLWVAQRRLDERAAVAPVLELGMHIQPPQLLVAWLRQWVVEGATLDEADETPIDFGEDDEILLDHPRDAAGRELLGKVGGEILGRERVPERLGVAAHRERRQLLGVVGLGRS
jgi:hypothetical protein